MMGWFMRLFRADEGVAALPPDKNVTRPEPPVAALPVAPVAPLAPVPAIRAEASRYSHMKAERLADAMGSVQRTPLTQENGITFLGEPLEPSVTWLPPGFFDRVQPRDATLADAARDEHTLKDGTVLKL